MYFLYNCLEYKIQSLNNDNTKTFWYSDKPKMHQSVSQEQFEDTKRVIRICNGQRKKGQKVQTYT